LGRFFRFVGLTVLAIALYHGVVFPILHLFLLGPFLKPEIMRSNAVYLRWAFEFLWFFVPVFISFGIGWACGIEEASEPAG